MEKIERLKELGRGLNELEKRVEKLERMLKNLDAALDLNNKRLRELMDRVAKIEAEKHRAGE